MRLLAGKTYDPTTAASVSTASLLAMTAFDTTNLRLTFTGPSSGVVMVRARCTITGATSMPTVLLGVLDGATVKVRQAPYMGRQSSGANGSALNTMSALVAVTPGTSYTWDLAYGVELAVASSVIKWGGPDNATSNDQYGGIVFEVWDAPGLLAWQHYDPGTAVANKSVASGLAMTALDTTNLRCTFAAPSGGNVYVRLRGVISGTTGTTANYVLGVLDGSTVRGRLRPSGWYNQSSTLLATDQIICEAVYPITGLTGGTTYNFDAAYGVDSGLASGNIKYGGPNNTTQDDAWGGFSFDVWNADDLPRYVGSAV